MKKFLSAALGTVVGLGLYAAPADAHGVYFANRVRCGLHADDD